MAEKLSAIWKQHRHRRNKPGGVGTIGIMALPCRPSRWLHAGVGAGVRPGGQSALVQEAAVRCAQGPGAGQPGRGGAQCPAGLQCVGSRRRAGPGGARRRQARIPDLFVAGVGSQAHIAAEMFAMRAGLSLQHIPYNSVPAALTDVAGGQIDMMFAQLPAVLPFVKSGRVKVLAVAADARTPLLPDLPTLGEVGGPSISDAISWSAVMAAGGHAPGVARGRSPPVSPAQYRSPQVRGEAGCPGTYRAGRYAAAAGAGVAPGLRGAMARR